MPSSEVKKADMLEMALRAIVEAVAAQSPVITDSGMVQVWLDAGLIDAARKALHPEVKNDA